MKLQTKKATIRIATFLLVCLSVLSFSACGINKSKNTVSNSSVLSISSAPKEWDAAMYKEDKTLGIGAKTLKISVFTSDKQITFTLKTNAETLGSALSEHNLIEGEAGAYGLYVKKVNGILADFDKDKTYWALYKDGEMCSTGVDSTKIFNGEHYEFKKQK